MTFRRSRRRSLTLFATSLVASLAMTSCGGGGEQAPSDDAAPVVRLQGLEGGLSSMALKIIKDQGFDKANGFTAENFEVSGDASVQFFLQGDADVSFDGDPLTAALLRSQGNDVTTYFPMAVQDVAIVVRGDSPYQTEQDLIGKRVGHDGLDSGSMTAGLVMLNDFANLDIEEQYDLQLTQEAALLRLLDRGDLEAVFTAEPNTIIAAKEYGMRPVWGPGWQEWEAAAGGRSWNITAMARDSWISENPELAAGVQKAWNAAYDWIVADPSRVTSGELGDLIGIEGEEVAAGFEELIKTSEYFTKRWTEEDVAAAESFIQKAAAAGLGGLTEAPQGAVTRIPESSEQP